MKISINFRDGIIPEYFRDQSCSASEHFC